MFCFKIEKLGGIGISDVICSLVESYFKINK